MERDVPIVVDEIVGMWVSLLFLPLNWTTAIAGFILFRIMDVVKPYPARHRGLHRLMVRDDGQTRCVACMMCPTVCPAHCITIVPEEAADGTIEKRPRIFEIDELRCVVCGLCAEACPCDAIRMDTLEHAKPVYRRVDAILDRDELLSRSAPSEAVQGGVGNLWREKVKGETQTPAGAPLVPAGPPPGPTVMIGQEKPVV